MLGLAVVASAGAVAINAWRGAGADAAAFAEVLGIVAGVHVSEPDEGGLASAAIAGMVQSLDDPYSVYVPAEMVASFEKDLTGEYSGIGALIESRDGWLTIVTPLEDSPAYRAGLLPDDRIELVNGVSTEGMLPDEAVGLLTGERGTEVVLTVRRELDEPTFEVVIERAPIVTRTVKGVRRDPDDPETWLYTLDVERGIGYLRVTQFTPDTPAAFDGAMEAVVEAGLRGLIVDVRGNPGGLMEASAHLVDRLLDDGLIVSASGPAVGASRIDASESGTRFDGQVLVLIDGQSASASEIFAGAIVGNGRGVALGTRTFGKGSVQGVFNLTDGSELKLTQAWYRVADGVGGATGERAVDRSAQDDGRWGVEPSSGMRVEMTVDELIAAREAMVAIDRLGDGPDESLDWSDVSAVLDRRADLQLRAAHAAMAGKLDTGDWGRPGGDALSADEIAAREVEALVEARAALVERLAELDARLAELDGEGGEPADDGSEGESP